MLLAFLAFDRVNYPLSKQLEVLGTKSFGVYLVHSLALTVVSKVVYHVAPALLAWQGVYQPVLIVSALALPLILMAIVNRSPARKLYAYQFG
jgi:surface polysaccharide O-acyltransferase-like enzyme